MGKYAALIDALREDIRDGYFRRIETVIREEVYDLDMATAINVIHPAPAVVVAGSVLEEHVRKLATANGIEAYDDDGKGRKFENLMQELRKTDPPVISEPQRKVLAGWYRQRTEAAHARWENVIAEDVPRIIEGVRDFLARHPA